MRGFTVENRIGKVNLIDSNLLVKDTDDMESVEYWEQKLIDAGQAFVLGYREIKGRIYYSIYTGMRRKGSIFK